MCLFMAVFPVPSLVQSRWQILKCVLIVPHLESPPRKRQVIRVPVSFLSHEVVQVNDSTVLFDPQSSMCELMLQDENRKTVDRSMRNLET